MKRRHGDTRGFQAGGQRSGVEQAVDQHLVAGLFLRQGEIHGEAFQAPQFQVFD